MKLKTFKDLEFKPHPLGYKNHIQATITLNGCEISVIQGSTFYCGFDTYEIMSDRTHQKRGIRGWLTKEQITKHMVYVQKHPKK